MLLPDFASQPPPVPTLVRDPVWLRPARFSDHEAWRDLRETSREHLTQWEPAWRDEEATREAFRARVKAYWRETRRGAALPLFVFRRGDSALVGGVTLSNIRYGASRSAGMGYWIGAPFIRQGYGLAAIDAVLGHAFETMGLNRVEAACQPENTPSIALLRRAGFAEEGRARDYLKINDRWRDHLLFALTASGFRNSRPAD